MAGSRQCSGLESATRGRSNVSAGLVAIQLNSAVCRLELLGAHGAFPNLAGETSNAGL